MTDLTYSEYKEAIRTGRIKWSPYEYKQLIALNGGRFFSVKKIHPRWLWYLVADHKAHCTGKCKVSTFSFLPLYERLLGRKAGQSEIEHFL